MTLLKSLSHRPFALLWGGQSISRLGDGLYRIALAWWVLEETDSATAMGTVMIFSFAPMLLFLLIGGVAVDRFSRLRLMLASDLLRGAVVAIVAWLAFSQQLDLWHVYVASIVFGFVDAFFQPAYTAAVPEITPGDLLPSANSLTSLSGQVVGIIGPGLGSFIVGLGGTPAAFALDALSFFVSAACLAPLSGLPTPRRAEAHASSVVRDLREGIGAVLASPWLWITIAIAALANVTQFGPIGVALPFLVSDTLHLDVTALGLIQSMVSAGSVAGAVWMGRAARVRRRGRLGYSAWIVSGVATLAFGLPITIAGIALAGFVIGVCLSLMGLIWTHTLQEMVPREVLGRVSSIDYLGSFVLLPVGYGLTGWATDRLGAPLVFVIGGALTAGLAVLGLAHPAVRRLD